jgi:Stress responsive A/B Barrel Domain
LTHKLTGLSARQRQGIAWLRDGPAVDKATELACDRSAANGPADQAESGHPSIMIRHIVFFSTERDSNIGQIQEGLTLLTRIPHALRLEVALNRKSDPLSKEIDIVVYGEFESDAALAAYKVHELYREAVRRVRPLRELRLAADYDVAAAISRSESDV